MKKAYLLLIPVFIALVGCETFKIGLDPQGHHSSGLDKSISGQGDNDAYRSYQTYGGDIFVTDGKSNANLTFGNFTDNLSDIKDIDTLNSYIIASEENFFLSIEGPQNVGTKKDDGLFVGANSKYSDGLLSFEFTKDIKYVEIIASPYFYIDTSWNSDEPVVDDEVGISVNDSLYVPLVSTLDSETKTVKETTCKFDVSNKEEDKNKISLRVKQKRAFLKKITLYY